MKLRIRCGVRSAVVEVKNCAVTLDDLKNTVQSALQINENQAFNLSLNAATSLSEDGQATLASLDIVSGDLIHVIFPPGHNQPHETNSLSKSPHSTVSSQHQAAAQINTNEACKTEQNMEVSQSATSVLSGSESGTNMDVNPNEVNQEEKTLTDSTSTGEIDDTVMDAEVNRYLKEPMMIRESTADSLPQCLLVAHANWKPANNHEAVVVVLHLLMTELGYKSKTLKNDVWEDWRISGGGGALRLEYSYPQIEGAIFQLVCVPMKAQIVVHGTVPLSDDKFHKVSVHLKTSEYINSVNSDAYQVYKGQQLYKLSNVFKDGVAYPLLQISLADRGLGQMSGLSTFVYELQFNIFKYLDVTSLLRVSQTCQSLNDVTKDPTLWRRIFLRDFGRRAEMKLSQDWMLIYKNKHLERKHSARLRHNVHPLPFFGRRAPPLPAFNPYPPGFVIGGDYDLNPPGFPNPFAFSDPNPFRSNAPLGLPRPLFPEPMDQMIDQELLTSVHPSMNRLSNPMNNVFGVNHDRTGRSNTGFRQTQRFF